MSADLLGVVPTHGRPDAVPAMVRSWIVSDVDRVDLLFVVDENDSTPPAYRRAVEEAQTAPFPVRMLTLPHGDPVAAANHAAVENAEKYPMLAVLPDNHDPLRGWSDLARLALGLGEDGPWIAHALSHTARPWSAGWFVTSSIVQALGYLAPTGVTVAGAEAVWSRWGRESHRLVNLTPSWVDEYPTFTADHDAALGRYRMSGQWAGDALRIRVLAEQAVPA